MWPSYPVCPLTPTPPAALQVCGACRASHLRPLTFGLLACRSHCRKHLLCPLVISHPSTGSQFEHHFFLETFLLCSHHSHKLPGCAPRWPCLLSYSTQDCFCLLTCLPLNVNAPKVPLNILHPRSALFFLSVALPSRFHFRECSRNSAIYTMR